MFVRAGSVRSGNCENGFIAAGSVFVAPIDQQRRRGNSRFFTGADFLPVALDGINISFDDGPYVAIETGAIELYESMDHRR